MAEEEAEREYNTRDETVVLKQRFQALITSLRDSTDSPLDASARFCHEFCQILVEHGGQWKSEEDPLPLLEMYTVAILCFAEATPSLLPECEHVTVVLEKLALSCLDFLLSLLEKVPDALWKEFQSSVKVAHGILEANGNLQLNSLMALANESGVWTNSTLCSLLSNYTTDVEKVHELLVQEGPTLLDMRIKHLIKQRCVEKAAVLAKACAEFPEFGGKKNFKQIYLVCLCETMSQQELMQEIKDIDCKDALDMICNLESEENEKGALYLCTAFLKRQLLQGDVYCAWELTLFWSKLLIRLESAQAFLEQCRLLAQLSDSVYHILLLIKVIQAEVHDEGLPVCIEMCIQALKMGVSNSEDSNSTICKTISCLLPLDLEVKRACQLTEFLVKPSVDSYYAVEMLFNEPDQKLEEENLPLPNSLRCDLLLALKTKWPFDPEFWDWKTLKRHCLALMGEDASIVSSMDKLNDSEDNEVLHESDDKDFSGHLDFILGSTSQPRDLEAERKKKREMKRLREQGFVSARFRNWQAYMQYCVLCDKEFLGHRIVKHALKHVQDGIFRCPICAKTFETRAVLEPHVASHVKQSSKERLAALNTKNTNSGSANTLWSSSKPVYIKSSVKDGQMVYTDFGPLNTNSNTTGKVKTKPCSAKRGNPVREIENTEDCSCPVTSCQKVFKYFRNLVAHVKAHKDEEEARHFLELQSQKAICQYCRRQFVNVTHLNDHLQIHSGDRPYVCIQLGCNSSFNSHAELVMHRKVHSEFQAQCTFQDCGRVFNEAYLLYDHEAQHYITFICKSDNCDQVFYSLSQLNAHQKEHTRPENGEDIGDQMEALPQSFLNLEWMSNQEGVVPYVSSPLQTKQTQNAAHDTRERNHYFSFMNESSAELNQPPVTAPPVAQVCDLIRASKTVCQMQSDVEHLTQFCLKSCYVKLQPIPIKRADSVLLNALKGSEKIGQLILQDKKLFCCTCEQHKTVQKASGVQSLVVTSGAQSVAVTSGAQSAALTPGAQSAALTPGAQSAALTPGAQSAALTPGAQSAALTPGAQSAALTPGAQSAALTPGAQSAALTPGAQSMAVTLGAQSAAVTFGSQSAAVTLGAQSVVLTPGAQRAPVTLGAQSVVLTPGAQRAAVCLEAQSAPVTLGAQSAALSLGAQSAAVSLGAQCAAVSLGAQCAAVSLGAQCAAVSLGAQSAAVSLGAQCAPVSLGAQSAAVTFGAQSAAVTLGAQSAAVTLGAQSAAVTLGAHSVAFTPGAQRAVVTPDVQNITITNESAQPLASNNLENEDDDLTHVCPFESCTRKYSTLKSLSRHIKHVHIEAFEEWKLSRKYKRIADIAARKSSEPKNCNFQTHKKKIKPSTALKFTGINLDKFPTDPTIPDPFPPFNVKFEGAQNETQETDTTLMQSQMAESWTSSSFEGCNSTYSLPNQFPSMIMSDGLQQSYTSFTDLLAERDIDYVPSLSAAGITPTGNTDSHSGVLNEASKYVSNSLRVLHALNSDQTCEMSQVEASEELRYMETRQTNNSVPPNVNNVSSVQNSGQNFDPYFSSYSADTCSNSGQPLEKDEKQCTIDQTGLYFSPDVKTQCSLPVCKEEPECFSVSSVDTTVKCDQNNDFPTQEMSQVTTEDASPEVTDIMCSDDISKLKKIKTSKRTKWPAILKDGKVICCRCYREFSSTKSLGGHLSKRSQCKPVDEIDLTADLPISFLDFLNDPEISTMQSPLHMSNGQDSQSFIHDSDNVLNNTCFVDGPGLNYNIQNGHVTSGDAAETSFTEPQDQTENSSSMPFLNLTAVDLPTISDNDALRNFETQIPSTVPGEDGKILEIERALQRLDLVDGLPHLDLVKVEKPTLQNLNNTETTNKKISKTPRKDESHDVGILKPFRCIKADCAYGAMTKEALFKHLTRVHEESEDCINELKKNPEKLSPYACSMCSKTFTRTTGLKIHYKNVHHLSKEEISKIKIGRPGKKSLPSNNFSCVNKSPVSLTYSSSVQAQSMTSPTFTVAATNINNKPAELSKEKRFEQESSFITQSSACVLQNNPSLSLILEKDIKTLQDPCCTTDNPNVQCFTQDIKPALATELLFSPGRHCDLEPVTKAIDHVVEPMMEQNDLTKKTKCKEKTESPKKEKTIHTKLGRKSDFVDTVNDLSLYRPYRCVHEGCVAAFSVQHNLLLHYKAMHDSEVLNQTAETIIGSPEQDEGSVQIHEFKCQMKDCSKVVTKVTSLLKHYLLLHRCTLDKACSLLSGVEVGTFQCDQSKCPAQFTCHLKYIEHIKNDHKAIRLSADGDFERVDLTFACEYEGCDRVYTTKSNLLRHVLKKHQTVKPKQKNPDRGNGSAKAVSGKPNDGKENILINKIKQRKKLIKKKEKKANDHWTSFAKPTLKTKDEASATCTGKSSLEYPCMIKGCDSVSNTERNIVKHYTTHGLTERYINNRRSHFIFSKRNSRLRNKDVNELDGVSAVTSEVTKAGSAENNADKGGATADKDIVNADEFITNTEKGDTAAEKEVATADEEVTTGEKGTTVEKKSITTATTVKNEVPNTEKGFTNAENTVVKSQGVLPENKTSPETEKLKRNSVPMPVQVKRKRGRPRKLEKTVKVIPERKSLRNIRPIRSNHVPKVLGTKLKPATHKEQAENGVAQKLFSPLGLKASILKLYEESPSRNTVRSKLAQRVLTNMPLKRQLKKHQALGNKIYTKSLFQLIGKRKYVVHFRNPLKLESVKNVKIVMDGSFSNGADLLLKQLQDMRPMVILKKWLCS